MIYSLSQIRTTEDCDALIQSANMEREDLQFRKQQQERQYHTVSSGSTEVDADLSAVNSEIAGIEGVINDLPAGPTKVQFQTKLIKLNYKKFLLEERKVRYGVFALLEKEYAINCVEQELSGNQAYLDALNQRKTEL